MLGQRMVERSTKTNALTMAVKMYHGLLEKKNNFCDYSNGMSVG